MSPPFYVGHPERVARGMMTSSPPIAMIAERYAPRMTMASNRRCGRTSKLRALDDAHFLGAISRGALQHA